MLGVLRFICSNFPSPRVETLLVLRVDPRSWLVFAREARFCSLHRLFTGLSPSAVFPALKLGPKFELSLFLRIANLVFFLLFQIELTKLSLSGP